MKIITRAFRLPNWLLRKYRILKSDTIDNKLLLESAQAELFHNVGLSRNDGIRKLEAACLEIFGRRYDESDGMFSEHLVLLSAISCNMDLKIRSILEVGTFDGRTAGLLSKLFTGASIVTIDLPDESEEFTDIYQRSDTAMSFAEKRNQFISKFPFVKLEQMNSINLTSFPPNQFDLIWIDGAHGYPTVAIDIVNALRLATDGGIVMVDDVWKDVKKSDPIYISIGAYETLVSLVSADAIQSFTRFCKRLHPHYNIKGSKKYVGFFRKPFTTL